MQMEYCSPMTTCGNGDQGNKDLIGLKTADNHGVRSKVIKASFWAMIQMNSSESKTDLRERQAIALYPAKDVTVIPKAARWTAMETDH